MIAKVIFLGIARFTKLLQFVYARPKVRSLRMKRPNITWMHSFVQVVKPEGSYLPTISKDKIEVHVEMEETFQTMKKGVDAAHASEMSFKFLHMMEFQRFLTVMRIFLFTTMEMYLQIMNQTNLKRNQRLFNRMPIIIINISL